MYRHVLVPLDGSALAEQVLPHVRTLARSGPDTRVTLLRVVPFSEHSVAHESSLRQPDFRAELEAACAEARNYLDRVASDLRSAGYAVSTEVSHNNPADAITEYAERHHVDLIAMATHGRGGLGRWIFGSVTQKVVPGTKIPLLVVRPKT